MHVEIMDLLRAADEFIVIEAFREAGKTTKAEEHMILAGCFGNWPYGLLIGETYEKACERLASISHECLTNERLHEVFGGPVLSRRPVENKIFFKSGTLLQAWGWDQELQSFKYRSYRPQFAFLDDVENKERVRDAAAVNASMEKLHNDLIPAMDTHHFKVVLSQTRRAEDCMVTRLAGNPDWLYRGYPICRGDPESEDAVPTWPQRYPLEWIRKRKRSYERAGMLSSYLQSYMLQASNPQGKPFKEEMLAAVEVSPWHWMPRFAIYDPSRTSREKRIRRAGVDEVKSDRTGKVVVSRLGSQILVHESSGNYWQPNELVADLFATQQNHRPAKIGIEKNSLDDWLLQPIRLEMLRRGEPLPLQFLLAPQDRSKDEFIMGLQPFAQAKDIVLVGGKVAHPQLVAEWCNFPSGPRDVLNALAYALRMFSGSPMYEDFSGANIGEAPNARGGEEVIVGWQGSPAEVVAVGCLREGRRICVAGDWSATGALADAVKTIAFELRATFPRARLQCWLPADTYDQWQRIALVPALRTEKLTPYRGEHVAVARGCLAERIRTVWRNARLLTVDRKATLTLNALSTGYALPAEKGGRLAQEPEPGLSRMAAEALECAVKALDRQEDASVLPKGANIAHTPSGVAYVSSNPRTRV